MLSPSIKLTTDLVKWQRKQAEKVRKAFQVSLRKASYQLMAAARDDLRLGRLRLRKLSYLSHQPPDRRRKTYRGKRRRITARRARAPLWKLRRGIYYTVNRAKLRSEVGFLDRGSHRWYRQFAAKHAEGYVWQYSDARKRALHAQGIHIKKATRRGHVPARDIMGAVKYKHEGKAIRRVREYFAMKMRGERI